MDFRNRTVVVGVGGGIAAYKACELVRLIVKRGGRARVAMTPAATRFVAPLTFQALSGAPALLDLLDPAAESTYGHLALARMADLVILAPATADLIARVRAGMADDAVTTTVLAATCPVLVAPAMNTRMWRNPATQENLAALRARGLLVVGPAAGELADGDGGEGRHAEPEDLSEAALQLLGPRALAGRRVLVTAGPTARMPRARRAARFSWVTGFRHMRVFIAGATSTGQVAASTVVVTASSAMPARIRATRSAVAGATTTRSAMRASARCP